MLRFFTYYYSATAQQTHLRQKGCLAVGDCALLLAVGSARPPSDVDSGTPVRSLLEGWLHRRKTVRGHGSSKSSHAMFEQFRIVTLGVRRGPNIDIILFLPTRVPVWSALHTIHFAAHFRLRLESIAQVDGNDGGVHTVTGYFSRRLLTTRAAVVRLQQAPREKKRNGVKCCWALTAEEGGWYARDEGFRNDHAVSGIRRCP